MRYGNYTYALQIMTDKIIGLDMSAGMLAQAKNKYPEISFIQGDVINLPFESETFDRTIAIQVLHYIKEKERFF